MEVTQGVLRLGVGPNNNGTSMSSESYYYSASYGSDLNLSGSPVGSYPANSYQQHQQYSSSPMAHHPQFQHLALRPTSSSSALAPPGGGGQPGVRLTNKQRNKAHRSQSARPPTRPVIRLQRGRTRDLEEGQLEVEDLIVDPASEAPGEDGRSSYNPFLNKNSRLQDGGSRGGSGTPEGSPMPGGSRRKDLNRLAAARRSRGFAAASSGQLGPDQLEGEELGEDGYRLRNFSLTPKGIVNRGDSIRRRNSRSNSIPTSAAANAPPSATLGDPNQHHPTGHPLRASNTRLTQGYDDPPNTASYQHQQAPSSTFHHQQPAAAAAGATAGVANRQQQQQQQQQQHHHKPDTISYRVALLGMPGVGKNALVNQFMTSECINVYERSQSSDENNQDISIGVVVNGAESELVFTIINNAKLDKMDNDWIHTPPHAFVLQYSVTDKSSIDRLEYMLARLQGRDLLRNRATIVVGNKTDLVRSRTVSDQAGKELASSYKAKFIEISVACNHNVDELLVGLINQISLHLEAQKTEAASGSSSSSKGGGDLHRRPTTLVRASRRVKRVFSKVWGKSDDKDCEDLSVL